MSSGGFGGRKGPAGWGFRAQKIVQRDGIHVDRFFPGFSVGNHPIAWTPVVALVFRWPGKMWGFVGGAGGFHLPRTDNRRLSLAPQGHARGFCGVRCVVVARHSPGVGGEQAA